MLKQKSITVNFIMNAILTVSGIIFPLITFPYVSRVLLPEGTGKVSFAVSVVTYFSLFAQLGIPTYGIRACAQVRDDRKQLTKTVHELFFINLCMAVFCYIAFFIALAYVPRFQKEKELFLIVSLTILLNAIGMEWLYKALEQYTYITIRSIIFKVIAVIAMFILVKEQKDYVIYGGITIFAASASNILNFLNLRKHIDWKLVGGYQLKKHWKPIAIFFAMACATTIYTNLDTVMLGFMKTDVDVGYYNAAVKVKGVLLGLVTSLAAVLLPRASYYLEQGLKEEFLKISNKSIRFVIMFALPCVIYFTIFARESILFLSGSAYEGAILPMQLIMPTIFLIGLTNVMGIQMMVPMGKERKVLYSVIVGAVVDLIVNFFLIPKMASAGAAIGTLLAEVVVWIVQYIALREIVKDAYLSVQYGKLVVALVIGSAASFWVKMMTWNLFVVLALSAILFFGIYVCVLIVMKERLIMELIERCLVQ